MQRKAGVTNDPGMTTGAVLSGPPVHSAPRLLGAYC
ncbi:MAG: hypothetical protein JWO79_1786 [Actinomycetia bacterium]|nr:hypothetical protein [Actinomycetes bacterium]